MQQTSENICIHILDWRQLKNKLIEDDKYTKIKNLACIYIYFCWNLPLSS